MNDLSYYYDGLITNAISNKQSELEQLKREVETLRNSVPTELGRFPEYFKSIEKEVEVVNSKVFDVSSDVLATFVMADMTKDKDSMLAEKISKYDEIEAEINSVVESIKNENIQYNESLQAEVDEDNLVFNELKAKRDKLMEHSQEITDLCYKFGITTTDINLEEETLDPNKLNKLYDEFIRYMNNNKGTVNPIRLAKDKIEDIRIQFAIIAVVFILCFTPLLTLLSIAFVVFSVYGIKSTANRVKYFSVLQAILYKVNLEKIPHSVVDETLLRPTEFTDEELDAMAEEVDELKAITAKVDLIEQQYNEEEYDIKEQQLLVEVGELKQKAEKEIDDASHDYDLAKKKLVSELGMLKQEAEITYNELKSKYVGFGHRFTEDGWFNTELTLGFNDWIEEKIDTGEKNIIIRPGQNEELLNSFIKCLYVNAINNVYYMKLTVHVIDPNNMGQVIIPFYNQAIDKQLKIIQKDIGTVLTDFTTIAQRNLELTKGKSVQEYNRECQASGRDTIDYNLLIVLSQPKKLEDTENLKALFQYSFNAGIIIWVVSDNMTPTEDTYLFRKPFDGIEHPYKDQNDREWCYSVAKEYADKIANYKPPSVSWDKFIAIACPPEKEWTFNADDNIDMYPGFQNGDPELYPGFHLGNGGNVHALAVGTTGAGKSIFLNHIIMTLCKMYSPRELELWLCDFKGTEFKFYMESETFPYSLPQIKACLCTSDGDFATSVFHAVRKITDDRFEQMKVPNETRERLGYDDGQPIPNFDNAKNWNQYWRARAKDTGDDRYLDNCYKRIILLSDEFQVIFQAASDKNLTVIKEDMTQIAKLGRAANVHMFFASQSMRGTLSGDILNQFSLRFALRCTEDVATDIMGTNYAANLPRFGQLYVAATGIRKEDQPRFYTPFISKDVQHEATKELAERAIKDNMPKNDVITYEEVTKYPLTDLDEFYESMDKNGTTPTDGTLIAIGNRMAYSTNKAPDNFIVTRKNNENIFACFSDYNDYIYMFNTLMCNIRHSKENCSVVINSQIDELDYLVDAPSWLTNRELTEDLIKQPVTEFIKWMEGLIKRRKETGKTDPAWIFLLGWDKGTGFGVDTNITLRSNFNAMMQQCGVYGIHVVMFVIGFTGINITTLNTCKYIMAGKCSIDDSMSILGTKQAGMAYEMKTGWVFVKRDSVITRDKLYLCDIERTVAKNELVL